MYHSTVLENPKLLREAASDLHQKLDGLAVAFESRQIPFEELRRQYRATYQPDAKALAKEMVRYAPHRIPDDIAYDSQEVPDFVIMCQSLTPERASSVLKEMAQSLSELMENVRA